MTPNSNPSRQRRHNRWARLRKQLTQAKAELNRLKMAFETEKKAKNEAYSFILCGGLFYDFCEWCKAGSNIDSLDICRGCLLTECPNNENAGKINGITTDANKYGTPDLTPQDLNTPTY